MILLGPRLPVHFEFALVPGGSGTMIAFAGAWANS
jgi:hypothetical protein